MNVIKTLVHLSTGDSIERKTDNQLHNRGGRNGLLEKKRLLVYIQKGTTDYNFRLLCSHSQLF